MVCGMKKGKGGEGGEGRSRRREHIAFTYESEEEIYVIVREEKESTVDMAWLLSFYGRVTGVFWVKGL